jgi:protocatechuate 3,4-dioxygenase, alpha subunit
MRDGAAGFPSGSQTVGPYFRIGLEYLIERSPEVMADGAGTIEMRGRVLDRDGVPVPDAMLEFWSASTVADGRGEEADFPVGFRRATTNNDGAYRVLMERPAVRQLSDGSAHAPHMLVLVFARGLLRHLITRVYMGDESSNGNDAVLVRVPEERRGTLIARPDVSQAGLYQWNVVLQGIEETVFFAW